MIAEHPISSAAISGDRAPATALTAVRTPVRKYVGAVKPIDLDAANAAVAAVAGNLCNPYQNFFRVPVIQIADPDNQPARWWLGFAVVDHTLQRILKSALADAGIATLQYRLVPDGLPARATVVEWLADAGLRLKP